MTKKIFLGFILIFIMFMSGVLVYRFTQVKIKDDLVVPIVSIVCCILGFFMIKSMKK